MGPLAEAAGEASPGGEVGGMAVAQVPLTNLNNKQAQHWRYKQTFLQSFKNWASLLARKHSIKEKSQKMEERGLMTFRIDLDHLSQLSLIFPNSPALALQT